MMSQSKTGKDRIAADADTLVVFGNTAFGIPLSVERDDEFDRIILVSQVITLPMQIILLSYQEEVSYTVLDLLHATADTYSTLRETLDAMEAMQTRAEQEQEQE